MQTMESSRLLEYLQCPQCACAALADEGAVVLCRACGRTYPVTDGVCDFVRHDQLGPTARRELQAINLYAESPMRRQHLMHRELAGLLQTHLLEYGVRQAGRYLKAYAKAGRTLCAFGCGGGFELATLAQFVRFERVLAGDISVAATVCTGENLAAQPGALGLLACEFEHCPVRRSPTVVGFVFEALHHTDNVHQTIEHLLQQNFDCFVLVEPTRNWLTDLLARRGLAMNVEYSGLKPDWIHLPTVRSIARRHGYHMSATTWWPLPDALVPQWIKRSPLRLRGFCWLLDVVSRFTALFQLGAMSAVHLWKSPSPDKAQ